METRVREVAKFHQRIGLPIGYRPGYVAGTGSRATSDRDGSDQEVTSVPDRWTSSRAGAPDGSKTPRG